MEEADFSEAKFKGDSSFDHGEFYGEACFCETEFSKGAFFYDTKFKGDFILWDARFSCLQMEWGTELTKFYVDWNQISKSLFCDYGPTYLSMVKSFKELERFDDADNCYFKYRKWSQREKPFGWSKLNDYLAWASCGYGVRPSYTILFGVLSIFLFGILFQTTTILGSMSSQSFLNQNPLIITSYFISMLSQEIITFSFFSYLATSLNVFITGNISDLSGIAKYIAMIELLVRGLLFALFVVVLTKKMIR